MKTTPPSQEKLEVKYTKFITSCKSDCDSSYAGKYSKMKSCRVACDKTSCEKFAKLNFCIKSKRMAELESCDNGCREKYIVPEAESFCNPRTFICTEEQRRKKKEHKKKIKEAIDIRYNCLKRCKHSFCVKYGSDSEYCVKRGHAK